MQGNPARGLVARHPLEQLVTRRASRFRSQGRRFRAEPRVRNHPFQRARTLEPDPDPGHAGLRLKDPDDVAHRPRCVRGGGQCAADLEEPARLSFAQLGGLGPVALPAGKLSDDDPHERSSSRLSHSLGSSTVRVWMGGVNR